MNGNPLSFIDPFGLAEIPNPVNVPGGPWEPNPGAQKPGNFKGPKPSNGSRMQCQWVPSEANGGPPGSKGYWKTNETGKKGWTRYAQNGNPMTPEQAHPSKNGARPAPSPATKSSQTEPRVILPVISTWSALLLWGVPGNLFQEPFPGGNEIPQDCGCSEFD